MTYAEETERLARQAEEHCGPGFARKIQEKREREGPECTCMCQFGCTEPAECPVHGTYADRRVTDRRVYWEDRPARRKAQRRKEAL